jgi:hypothetical protein
MRSIRFIVRSLERFEENWAHFFRPHGEKNKNQCVLDGRHPCVSISQLPRPTWHANQEAAAGQSQLLRRATRAGRVSVRSLRHDRPRALPDADHDGNIERSGRPYGTTAIARASMGPDASS